MAKQIRLKYLIFYPLWLCVAIYIWQTPAEVRLESRYERLLLSDTHIAFDIIREPKLVNLWLNGGVMRHNVTTSFLDEGNMRRHIVNMDVAGRQVSYILTYLQSGRNQNTANYSEYDVHFYIGSAFYDLHFRFNLKSAGINKRETLMNVSVTSATVNYLWKHMFQLAPYGHERYLADSINLLTKEVRRQYIKKLEVMRDFTIEDAREQGTLPGDLDEDAGITVEDLYSYKY